MKLLNVEDTSIFEDIRAVRDACKEILDDEVMPVHLSSRSWHDVQLEEGNGQGKVYCNDFICRFL